MGPWTGFRCPCVGSKLTPPKAPLQMGPHLNLCLSGVRGDSSEIKGKEESKRKPRAFQNSCALL